MEFIRLTRNGRSLYLKLGPDLREAMGVLEGDWVVVRVIGGRLDAARVDVAAGLKGTGGQDGKEKTAKAKVGKAARVSTHRP